jgi:hypothetical protein
VSVKNEDKGEITLLHCSGGSVILKRNFIECWKTLNNHTLPLISLLGTHPEKVYIKTSIKSIIKLFIVV